MAVPASCASGAVTRHHLKDFIGGWLVGHFDPTLVSNRDVEVAVKQYPAGAQEKRHHHKIATEYTVIATGKVRMNGRQYGAGEIVQIDPGVSTDFEAIEDTTTVVIKTPSVPDDKYIDTDDSRRYPDA